MQRLIENRLSNDMSITHLRADVRVRPDFDHCEIASPDHGTTLRMEFCKQ